jgi:acetate kinase
MGTRSGDLDPSVLLVLARREDMSPGELDEFLNKRSGVLGLAGVSDMRDIEDRRRGRGAAMLAFDVYIHRLRPTSAPTSHSSAAWTSSPSRPGWGELAARPRGGDGDAGLPRHPHRPERNEARERGIRTISTDDSAVTVLVVPTNEELEIARQTSRSSLRDARSHRATTLNP